MASVIFKDKVLCPDFNVCGKDCCQLAIVFTSKSTIILFGVAVVFLLSMNLALCFFVV